MKARDLREMDNQMLLDKLNALKKQLFEIRLKHGITGADKPHLFKSIKRDIARILTILNERRLQTQEK